MNHTLEFVKFSKRLKYVSERPLLTDSERNLSVRYAARFRRVASAQLATSPRADRPLFAIEGSAVRYASALVLFAREHAFTPAEADGVLDDIARNVAGETRDQRASRLDAVKSRQADADLLRRKHEADVRHAEQWDEREATRAAIDPSELAQREFFQEACQAVALTPDQQARVDRARTLMLDAVTDAMDRRQVTKDLRGRLLEVTARAAGLGALPGIDDADLDEMSLGMAEFLIGAVDEVNGLPL